MTPEPLRRKNIELFESCIATIGKDGEWFEKKDIESALDWMISIHE